MKAKAWECNLVLAVAFVLDGVLLFLLPRIGIGTGRFDRDFSRFAVPAFIAAITIWPCLRLIRIGEPWQQVLGLTFLVLPSFILLGTASRAISEW